MVNLCKMLTNIKNSWAFKKISLAILRGKTEKKGGGGNHRHILS